jgi:curli biogenesis system outer membrane secretion channel CsgG
MKPFSSHLSCLALCAAAALSGCADLPRDEAPKVDHLATTQTDAAGAPDRKLPHAGSQPVAVAVYQFRSNIPEIPERGTTDMFITALAQSHNFRVIDRSQASQSVMNEKQLNAQGGSDGSAAAKKLRGAQYIFEGAITQADASQTQRSSSIGVAGMSVSGGKNKDVVGIDVRIVDAATGDVMDVVSVHKAIKSDAAGVSGIGNLLSTIMGKHGHSSAYTPDASVQQQRKQGVDSALRAAIDEAVNQLSARF